MLSALLATASAAALAVLCALVVGVALGRLAVDFVGGRRLLTRLVELRGAVPTLVAAPLLDGWLHLPTPLTLGLLVGVYQSLAVSRWVRGLRLLGLGFAADRGEPSGGRIPRRRGTRLWIGLSPPVRTTIASCVVHVVTLEAILSALQLPPFTVSLGSLMAQALAPGARLGAVLTLTCLFLLLDQGSERLARRWLGPQEDAQGA